MAGPALRKADSHASIHEAALQEARELTNILGNLLKQRETDNALETAYIMVEHWETRTLGILDWPKDLTYLREKSKYQYDFFMK